MKEIISKVKENSYETFEFVLWGALLYLIIYMGFIGSHEIEESIYYFIEYIIG